MNAKIVDKLMLNARLKILQERILEEANSNANYLAQVVEATSDEIVEPGNYTVVEWDYGGTYLSPQFHFELTSRKNLKEIALDLYDKKKYFSPWTYLKIEPKEVDPDKYIKI